MTPRRIVTFCFYAPLNTLSHSLTHSLTLLRQPYLSNSSTGFRYIDSRIRSTCKSSNQYSITHRGRPLYGADLLQYLRHQTVHALIHALILHSSTLCSTPQPCHSFHEFSASLHLKFGIPFLFTSDNNNHFSHCDLKTHFFHSAYTPF